MRVLRVDGPARAIRWHRQWLRRHWTRLSQRKRPGRPTTSSSIRALVRTMTTAYLLWGAPRIHGELAKLGITVTERTVSRLLRRPRRPPSQTWRTFLTNHVATLISMDFFTVPTLTGRVLFVLVLLSFGTTRTVLAIAERAVSKRSGWPASVPQPGNPPGPMGAMAVSYCTGRLVCRAIE
jgi:hypothetical protein